MSDARLRWLKCVRCSVEFVGHYAKKYCDDCQPARRKANIDAWIARTPVEKQKELSRNKKFRQKLQSMGITVDEYYEVLKKQQYKCAICRRELDMIGTGGSRNAAAPYKDHDHKTGKFRGVLCGKCNRGLGLLGDSIEGINRAHQYLNTSWRTRSFK